MDKLIIRLYLNAGEEPIEEITIPINTFSNKINIGGFCLKLNNKLSPDEWSDDNEDIWVGNSPEYGYYNIYPKDYEE